ncbi:MAG: archease [Coxiellaceae bacterium]|nr:MAG: archease [Coxiellaceae bacterium]
MKFADIGYFDHVADIGIIGRGTTVEAAFEAAARALFAIMAPIETLHPQVMIHFEFDEADIEFVLVTWLNQLIARAKDRGLVLCQFRLMHHDNHWQGQAWGEPWRDTIVRGTEVKGATLTALSVKQIRNYWEAKCVLDV